MSNTFLQRLRRRKPRFVHQQIWLHLAVCIDHFANGFWRYPRFLMHRSRSNDRSDVDRVGIEQQSHKRLRVIRIRFDVRQHDHAFTGPGVVSLRAVNVLDGKNHQQKGQTLKIDLQCTLQIKWFFKALGDNWGY